MKDSERISNLEEMLADVFVILDKVDQQLKNMPTWDDYKKYDVKSLEEAMRELAKKELMLNDRQTELENSYSLLLEAARKNSENIDAYARNTLAKDDLSLLFDYMMKRFDATDERFKASDERFIDMKHVIDLQANRTEEERQEIWNTIQNLRTEVNAINKRPNNNS
jgi:hypothetical protein